MTALWYYETATFHGGWIPNSSETPPLQVKVGGVHRNGHTGPRIRGVVQVPAELRGASLDDLQAVLSPDRNPPPDAPAPAEPQPEPEPAFDPELRTAQVAA